MGLNSENAQRIVLDIETVASPDAAQFLEPVSAPANYKDPEKIAAYVAEQTQKQVERASLDLDLCEVVAVGYQIDGREVEAVTRADTDESSLVKSALALIEGRAVVGFNILGFDLPVLVQRARYLGLRVPSVNVDKYRSPHLDLMDILSFSGKFKYRGLAFYAKRFRIPTTDETTGADIAGLVAAGDWAAVERHVRCDIETTCALARTLGVLTV